MRNCENCTQDDADPSNGNISNSKERILASHDRAGGYYNRLGTTIDVDWEV